MTVQNSFKKLILTHKTSLRNYLNAYNKLRATTKYSLHLLFSIHYSLPHLVVFEALGLTFKLYFLTQHYVLVRPLAASVELRLTNTIHII